MGDVKKALAALLAEWWGDGALNYYMPEPTKAEYEEAAGRFVDERLKPIAVGTHAQTHGVHMYDLTEPLDEFDSREPRELPHGADLLMVVTDG